MFSVIFHARSPRARDNSVFGRDASHKKEKDRLAAVFPEFARWSGCCHRGLALVLPSPGEEPDDACATREQRQRGRYRGRVYLLVDREKRSARRIEQGERDEIAAIRGRIPAKGRIEKRKERNVLAVLESDIGWQSASARIAAVLGGYSAALSGIVYGLKLIV